ncbi:MAG: cell division protein FtsQ/DivIB [Mycobacterium leprae]
MTGRPQAARSRGARPPVRRGSFPRARSTGRAATWRPSTGRPSTGRGVTWQRLLALACLVTLGGLLGWVVLGSDLFSVRAVDVTGASRLTPSQVRAAGQVPIGTSLAAVDTDAVRRRVAALRPVARVDVSRRWPRTVRIAVVERRAMVAVPIAGAGQAPKGTPGEGGIALLDRRGVPFARVPSAPPGVAVLRVSRPGTGEAPTCAALDVLAALPPPVRARVTEVTADDPEAMTLRLQGGASVLWGGPDRAARKARVLAALLPRGAGVYDVSVPDVPTTR